MRLGKLILFVADVPKMVAFYRDVLGLSVVHDEPGWVVLDAGGTQVAIHEMRGEPPSDGSRRADCYLKHVFHVEDLAAARARLQAAGVALDPVHTYDGRSFCNAIDPEGNVFQLATG
jgi:catechol 2,3-dioxygenase-like lactoylglutathione lyase family enzyme